MTTWLVPWQLFRPPDFVTWNICRCCTIVQPQWLSVHRKVKIWISECEPRRSCVRFVFFTLLFFSIPYSSNRYVDFIYADAGLLLLRQHPQTGTLILFYSSSKNHQQYSVSPREEHSPGAVPVWAEGAACRRSWVLLFLFSSPEQPPAAAVVSFLFGSPIIVL